MQVSKVIRQHGFDIEFVANKMGLSKASLAKSICKTGNPSIGKLRQIADIIGCDLVEFFEDERKDAHNDAPPALQTTRKIKQIMKSKGLSVTEVAQRMGVLPQSLSRTLRLGSYRISTIKAITEAIGCDISDITDERETSTFVTCPMCGAEIEVIINMHVRNV